MESILFAFNLYRIQLRMIFGPKHRFRKEYDEALDAINLSGHWLYLYDSLEGPKAEQVRDALKLWVQAYQAKQEFNLIQDVEDPPDKNWAQALVNERHLKRKLHVLIYDNFKEDVDGYVSDV